MSEVIHRPPRQPFVPPGGFELLTRDMTATFSADCTLRVAQEQLATVEQWLPIDGDADATLGSLIDRNSTGPLRLGYGAWRDLLLGAQFLNGRGELITAGGKTVKNVAGYDLTKFLVGSFGVFSQIVTLTTRTYRKPDGALLVRHPPDPKKFASMIPTPLRPQWAVLTRAELLCGYLSDETTLAWYAANVGGDVTRRSLREDVEHRAAVWKTSGDKTSFRATVPPAHIESFTSRLTGEWVADPAFGIVLGNASDAVAIRESAACVGGSVRFGDGEDFDISTNPAERQIIERLKTAFDPDNRLRPLPWQSH
jgi:hypothetical protein